MRQPIDELLKRRRASTLLGQLDGFVDEINRIGRQRRRGRRLFRGLSGPRRPVTLLSGGQSPGLLHRLPLLGHDLGRHLDLVVLALLGVVEYLAEFAVALFRVI
jgi:hypothetical protein